jgi:hypothetical protein
MKRNLGERWPLKRKSSVSYVEKVWIRGWIKGDIPVDGCV